jgi:D-ribose pyranose/furanose isomerase RbsD
MRILRSLAALLLATAAIASAAADWREDLSARLALFGHRNWIVIADSAYPAQSGVGIETIKVAGSLLHVLEQVMRQVKNVRHVTPIVWRDLELGFVPEQDAPGVSRLREVLNLRLADWPSEKLPHEQIISKLDEAGKLFQVLIIKTDETIPYTSVFLQLDCAYWGPAAEARMRQAMAAGVK